MTEVVSNFPTILGMDQSLTSSGLVAVQASTSISSTVIKTGTRRGIVRLLFIEDILTKTLLAVKPALFVLEGYAFNPRAGQSFSLGELGGIVKRTAYKAGVPYISVSPGTLKKYVTGSGAAKKNVMLLGAFKKFGVSFASDDECDAYCLARVGEEFLQAQAGILTAAFKPIYKAICKYNDWTDGGDTNE